jgi:hypothetical protein
MDCFTHARTPAVGLCTVCQKAVCRDGVGRDNSRILCRSCLEQRSILGYEYRSSATVAGWPLIRLSLGLLVALGGALGLGISLGGLAVGSVAVGGAAIGLTYAVGGGAFAPAIIDGVRCDPDAAEFVRRWLGSGILPPSCL